jgi:hypothetical protein
MLPCLLAVAHASVELAEAEVAVGDEGAQFPATLVRRAQVIMGLGSIWLSLVNDTHYLVARMISGARPGASTVRTSLNPASRSQLLISPNENVSPASEFTSMFKEKSNAGRGAVRSALTGSLRWRSCRPVLMHQRPFSATDDYAPHPHCAECVRR